MIRIFISRRDDVSRVKTKEMKKGAQKEEGDGERRKN